jgi:salicylate hydroxylase
MQVKAKRPLRVVIIGAGIGGLAAACALRQRGFEVEIFERATKLEEVGAGLQIGPNSVKVFRALGLEDALRRNAVEPTNMVSLKWDDATMRFREPMRGFYEPKFGAPYMTAHRADLHNMLRAAAGDVKLRLNANCVGAETANGQAVARFSDGSEAEADVVIAADGIRSVIRAQHFGADAPRFTGMMAWRCMVPMDCVPTRVGPGGSVARRAANISAGSGRTVTSSPIRSAATAARSTFSAATTPSNGSKNPGRCRRVATN